MQLQTKYFGSIIYEAEDVLDFPEGLFAFEDERQYLLLPFAGSDGSMLCLQSVATPALAFVVMNPYSLDPGYDPQLRAEELGVLGAEKDSPLYVYTLCAVKSPVSDSTVNLRCPVVINPETNRAVQVILEMGDYHMRHLLSEFSAQKGGEAPC